MEKLSSADTGEQDKLEKQIRKLNTEAERFRIITEYMNDGLFIINSDGTYNYVNEQAKKMTQDPENIRKVGDNFVHSAYYDTNGRALTKDEIPSARVLRGETLNNVRIRVERPGFSGYFSYSGSPIYNEHGTLTSAVICFRDVTETYEYENNVRKLSEELRNIIDSTEDLIWSVDRNYRLLYYNAAFKSMVEENHRFTVEEGVQLKDVFPGEYHVWGEFYERAVSDGMFKVELRSPYNDRIFSYNFYPVYINSEIVEVTCFAKDLTERMKTEQRIVSQNSILETTVRERTVEQQEMVRNMQNFCLAISNDVKESFADIEKCAENILKKSDTQAHADRILQVSRNMTLFINEIIKYEMYSSQQLVKEDVNIKKLFTSVYKELKSNYVNQSKLAFETGFPTVSADQALLRLLVFNIISNALKFSDKRETAIIKVGCKEENKEYVFSVEDNGIGFDMNDASKLFNAFERLHEKDKYDGYGLGLSIVKSIIQRHGGRTWIESEPGIRTVVRFSLPINKKRGRYV